MHSQNISGRAYSVFADVILKAKSLGQKKVAVVNPTDRVSLEGAVTSALEGIIEPILIGDIEKIKEVALHNNIDISKYQIIDAKTDVEAANRAVELAFNNEVDALMKGNLHTDDVMRAVVKKDGGLRTSRRISHVFVIDSPAYHKMLLVTDAAINIAPDLETKYHILQNSIDLAQKLGVKRPKVAAVCAVEMVYDKMPSTIDADLLTKRAIKEGLNADVYGPLAFDNAINKEAALIKKIDSVVAGDADILLMPHIEAGNMVAKQFVYLGYSQMAGVVIGAKVPIILTSRADSVEARLASAAIAVLSK